MLHQSKSVISNSCLCLNCIRASFSTVMTTFQHPRWLLLSPTRQKSVALGFMRVWIHFIRPSGVVLFMYSRNGNWSLLPWTSNNPKGVGPSWCRSKKFSWSKYLSASVRIVELIDIFWGHAHKTWNRFTPELAYWKPRKRLTLSHVSSMVLLDSYGIDTH